MRSPPNRQDYRTKVSASSYTYSTLNTDHHIGVLAQVGAMHASRMLTVPARRSHAPEQLVALVASARNAKSPAHMLVAPSANVVIFLILLQFFVSYRSYSCRSSCFEANIRGRIRPPESTFGIAEAEGSRDGLGIGIAPGLQQFRRFSTPTPARETAHERRGRHSDDESKMGRDFSPR